MYIDRNFVQRKFSRIFRCYDFINSLLTLGIDHYWRWCAVKRLKKAKGVVLDLCAGTLGLTRALFRYTGFKGNVIALDFSISMLLYARFRDKMKCNLVCGDALSLPVKDKSMDAVMVGFGVRNLSDRFRGLKEIYRVMKQGATAVILEFSKPRLPVFREFYFIYLRYILPKIAGFASGDEEVYTYLAESIQDFYSPNEWIELMKKAGFTDVKHKYLSLGIVSIYEGKS